MNTNGDFVSRVVTGLKLLNKDEDISLKYVHKIGVQKSEFYLAQKAGDLTTQDRSNLYTSLDCFPLVTDNVVDCDIIEFRRCQKLMKSKVKLPCPIFSRNGVVIDKVTTLDGLTEITPMRGLTGNKNRWFAQALEDELQYFEKDGFLYFPDMEIERVNVRYMTADPSCCDEVSTCAEVGCRSVWDYPFIAITDMYERIIAETVQEVAMSHRQTIPDTNPNMSPIE